MSRNYFLEQCARLFIELGCPVPVDIEAVIVCEGRESETSPYQSLEECEAWLDGGDGISMSKASA